MLGNNLLITVAIVVITINAIITITMTGKMNLSTTHPAVISTVVT